MCSHNIGITGVSIGNVVPARADAYYDPRNKSECFQGKRVAILDDDIATAPPALVIYPAAATLSPHISVRICCVYFPARLLNSNV